MEGEEGTAGGVNDMVKSCQQKMWEFLIELKQPSPAISATARLMHSRKKLSSHFNSILITGYISGISTI